VSRADSWTEKWTTKKEEHLVWQRAALMAGLKEYSKEDDWSDAV